MKKDCAFQYYNGRTVVSDETNLTLDRAKELWNEHYDDMVVKTREGEEIEVAIWINMENDSDYGDTLIHLCSPNVDDDGELWEKRYYGRI